MPASHAHVKPLRLKALTDGTMFGLVLSAYGFVAGPLGPWLSGYVLDITQGNDTLVFSSLGLMYLAATTLILMVQPWRECRI